MEEGDEKVSGEMQADHRESTGTRTGNMSGFELSDSCLHLGMYACCTMLKSPAAGKRTDAA